MKTTIIYIGLFISFIAGYYTNSFLANNYVARLESMIEYPDVIPFKQDWGHIEIGIEDFNQVRATLSANDTITIFDPIVIVIYDTLQWKSVKEEMRVNPNDEVLRITSSRKIGLWTISPNNPIDIFWQDERVSFLNKDSVWTIIDSVATLKALNKVIK